MSGSKIDLNLTSVYTQWAVIRCLCRVRRAMLRRYDSFLWLWKFDSVCFCKGAARYFPNGCSLSIRLSLSNNHHFPHAYDVLDTIRSTRKKIGSSRWWERMWQRGLKHGLSSLKDLNPVYATSWPVSLVNSRSLNFLSPPSGHNYRTTLTGQLLDWSDMNSEHLARNQTGVDTQYMVTMDIIHIFRQDPDPRALGI